MWFDVISNKIQNQLFLFKGKLVYYQDSIKKCIISISTYIFYRFFKLIIKDYIITYKLTL